MALTYNVLPTAMSPGCRRSPQATGHASIPQPSGDWHDVKVFIPWRQAGMMKRKGGSRRAWMHTGVAVSGETISRSGREPLLRVKSADRRGFLRKPQLQ